MDIPEGFMICRKMGLKIYRHRVVYVGWIF